MGIYIVARIDMIQTRKHEIDSHVQSPDLFEDRVGVVSAQHLQPTPPDQEEGGMTCS